MRHRGGSGCAVAPAAPAVVPWLSDSSQHDEYYSLRHAVQSTDFLHWGPFSGGVGDGGLRVPDSLPVECGWRLFFSYMMYLSRFHCTPLLYLPVCRLPLTPHNSNEAAQNAVYFSKNSAATNPLTPPAGFFPNLPEGRPPLPPPKLARAASQDSPIEQSAVRVQRGRQIHYRGDTNRPADRRETGVPFFPTNEAQRDQKKASPCRRRSTNTSSSRTRR